MIKNLICYGSKAIDIKDLVLTHLAQIKNNIKSFTDNHIFTDLTLELCDNHAMYKYNYTTQNWEVEKYL